MQGAQRYAEPRCDLPRRMHHSTGRRETALAHPPFSPPFSPHTAGQIKPRDRHLAWNLALSHRPSMHPKQAKSRCNSLPHLLVKRCHLLLKRFSATFALPGPSSAMEAWVVIDHARLGSLIAHWCYLPLQRCPSSARDSSTTNRALLRALNKNERRRGQAVAANTHGSARAHTLGNSAALVVTCPLVPSAVNGRSPPPP
jgi:hypothetical protein